MKVLNRILLFGALVFGLNTLLAQSIEKPSEGKALVYIAKTGAGPLVNFRIYDGDKFLGALSGFQYMVYECDPGEHLFWAASENRDYVEANLEANSVYVLNAEGQLGAFIAGVNFKPLNPNDFKDRKLFYQVIKHLTKSENKDASADKSENIRKGLEKYKELKEKGSSKIEILDSTWKFENADKPKKEK